MVVRKLDHQMDKVDRLGHEVTLLTKSMVAVDASINTLTDRMENRIRVNKVGLWWLG